MSKMEEEPEEEWCYRGEGNASIVVANVKDKIIYRIAKSSAETKKQNSDVGRHQDLFHGLDFVEKVMKGLISLQFLVPMRVVEVSPEIILNIQTVWRLLRPDHRLCKDVDSKTAKAIEMPDLCSFEPSIGRMSSNPTYAVEIKPKCGFLPRLKNLADVKTLNCRFCMHQNLKIKERKWSRKSSYCPIDLFSGCQTRIRCAIRSLFDCPQNNLRIFKNGKEIWSNEVIEKISKEERSKENNGFSDDLLDVLVQCLLYESTEHPSRGTTMHKSQKCNISTCDHSCNEECSRLPSDSVLSNILNVQRLDDLDIEGLFPSFGKVCESFAAFPEQRVLSGLDGPYTNDWLKLLPSIDSLHSSSDFNIYKIKQYLVSRSAKDCSIFISFQEIASDYKLPAFDKRTFVAESSGKSYVCRVSIIDLDPKSFDKIPFYSSEDNDVVQSVLYT